jgi:hypothetical protein
MITADGGSEIITNANVVSGAHLNFRYRARNVQGWSDYSPETMIVAATISDPPTLAETLAIELDTQLTFSWIAPVNTGGDSVVIDGYMVIVQHYDGVTYTETPDTFCEGFDTTLVSTMSCKVEMAELRIYPFFL